MGLFLIVAHSCSCCVGFRGECVHCALFGTKRIDMNVVEMGRCGKKVEMVVMGKDEKKKKRR